MSRSQRPDASVVRRQPARSWLIGSIFLALTFVLSTFGTAVAQDDPLPSYVQLAEGETLAEKQEITIGVNRNLVNGEEDFWFAHASLQVWQPLIKYDNEFKLQPSL